MKIVKAFCSVLLIANFICVASVLGFFVREERKRRRLFIGLVSKYGRVFAWLLNIEIVVEHRERLQNDKNYLFVANHMSYLDAIFFTALRPLCFITSIEMRELPVLGFLTELGGCIYTERRSRNNQKGEISEITKALQDGFDIIIFPEATSTNGESVLPFKRSLLSAVLQSGRDILPLAIQYEQINGEKVTAKNRDSLCWYGDMSFAPHFLALQGTRGIRIRVKVLEEIPVTAESTRDTLVEQCYDSIRNAYEPIV